MFSFSIGVGDQIPLTPVLLTFCDILWDRSDAIPDKNGISRGLKDLTSPLRNVYYAIGNVTPSHWSWLLLGAFTHRSSIHLMERFLFVLYRKENRQPMPRALSKIASSWMISEYYANEGCRFALP